ncbi:MAG: hypothetical protein ACLGSH_19810 [Acidobacteriota bacterium]
MLVRTLGQGREVTGIYVGERNARRYFPRHAEHVELHLGHLHIHCDLPPEFWADRPEIRDPRLAGWLHSRFFHGSAHRAPVPLILVPQGKHAFRVQPFTAPPPSMGAMTRIGPPVAVQRAQK